MRSTSPKRLPHAAALRDADLRADRLHAGPNSAARFRLRLVNRTPTMAWRSAGLRRQRSPTSRRPTTSPGRRRLIEHVRTLYRQDDLTGLLPLGQSRVAGPARRKLQAGLHAGTAGAGLAARRATTAAGPGRRSRRTGRRPGRLPQQPDPAERHPVPLGRSPSILDAQRRRRSLVDSLRPRLLSPRPPTPLAAGAGRRRDSTSSCRAAIATHSERVPQFDTTPTTCWPWRVTMPCRTG